MNLIFQISNNTLGIILRILWILNWSIIGWVSLTLTAVVHTKHLHLRNSSSAGSRIRYCTFYSWTAVSRRWRRHWTKHNPNVNPTAMSMKKHQSNMKIDEFNDSRTTTAANSSSHRADTNRGRAYHLAPMDMGPKKISKFHIPGTFPRQFRRPIRAHPKNLWPPICPVAIYSSNNVSVSFETYFCLNYLFIYIHI